MRNPEAPALTLAALPTAHDCLAAARADALTAATVGSDRTDTEVPSDLV